ncbi:hypothetical protein J6590_090496 [Homalodisca vitripennis]|nr:hypothetical protein J6590_090496 [Homalodisca vitripennis]
MQVPNTKRKYEDHNHTSHLHRLQWDTIKNFDVGSFIGTAASETMGQEGDGQEGKAVKASHFRPGLEEELLLLNWTSAPCRRHSNTAPPLSRQPARERITADISISCYLV